MRDLQSEYRREDGVVLIELRLNRLAQLFNTFDVASAASEQLHSPA
jgi:hypothetical protein